MFDMYTRIKDLCDASNISVAKMCADLNIRQGLISDLKSGRSKTLSVGNVAKIANYFGVSVGFLIGTDIEKASPETGERDINDEDIKFALFDGDKDITDEQYEEVKRFAAFIKERDKNK